MHRIKPAFSLTRLSQIAALATLNDTEYIKNSIQLAIKSREYLYTELVNISDLDVFKSKANYLLLDIRKTGLDSKILTKKLMEKGIIVRDCSSFRGLDDYWIRVNVGTIEDDKKFIEVLKEII